MNWRAKGIIQKLLSHLPAGIAVNDFLQVSIGDLRNFDGTIDKKVTGDWAGLVTYLHQVGASIQGKVLCEIGTGWYPSLPVAFHLAGAERIHTFDLTRHMGWERTERMLRRIERHLPIIADHGRCPAGDVEQRYLALRQSKDLDDFLTRARIDYHAPANAARTGLRDGSVDIVFSNSVLEHVPRAAIAEMMRESGRILSRGGLSVHCVACNDHYAHFDRTISFVNFLRFAERDWAFWNNSLHFQNRLRASDFLQLARDNGLDIRLEARAVRPGCREALKTMKVAPEFRHYDEEDLVTTTIDFIGAPR